MVIRGDVEASFFGAEQRYRSLGRYRCVVLRSGAEVSSRFRRLHMAEGAARGESRGGYWEGETSESHNPRGGSGMKQGQEDEGGEKRQEVEKT